MQIDVKRLKEHLGRALLAGACLLMLLSAVRVRAEEPADPSGMGEARDIFDACELTFSGRGDYPESAEEVRDGYYNSYSVFKKGDRLTLTSREPLQTLTLTRFDADAEVSVAWTDAEGDCVWEETAAEERLDLCFFAPDGAYGVTVSFPQKECCVSELAVYGEGELPASVQRWEAPLESPAFLLVCGYPGDELLYFGGLIPYCVSNGIPFDIVYIASYDRERTEEALQALWSLGVENEPVFLGCGNRHNRDVSYLLVNWKEKRTAAALAATVDSIAPYVIVTFPETGETDRLFDFKDGWGKQRSFGEAQTAAAGRIAGLAMQQRREDGLVDIPVLVKTDGAGMTVPVSDALGAYGDRSGTEVARETYLNFYKDLKTYGYEPCDTLTLTAADGAVTVSGVFPGDIVYTPLYTPIPTASPVPTAMPAPTVVPTPAASAVPAATAAPAENKTALSKTGAVLAAAGAGLGLAALIAFTAFHKRIGWRVRIPLMAGTLILTAVLAASAVRQYRVFAAASRAVSPSSMATPVPTAQATPAPQADSGKGTEEAPATDAQAAPVPPEEPSRFEEHFLHDADKAEEIVADTENGVWQYRSKDFAVEIKRYSETGSPYTKDYEPLVWFVADIYMREGTDAYRSVFADEARNGMTSAMPWKTARTYRSVLYINGDNMLNMEGEHKGTLIRDGHLYSNGNLSADVLAWNRRTLRFDYFPRGTYNAKTLSRAGYSDTFSFGPLILCRGEVQTRFIAKSEVRGRNPRCGIGTAEDGHTVAIVVDGRRPRYSVGVTLTDFARMFIDCGCTDAFNLDGGVSACMIFMGEQLNHHGNKDDISKQRRMPDGLVFGYSESVPTVDDPIYNDGIDLNSTEADYRRPTPTPVPTPAPTRTPSREPGDASDRRR